MTHFVVLTAVDERAGARRPAFAVGLSSRASRAAPLGEPRAVLGSFCDGLDLDWRLAAL